MAKFFSEDEFRCKGDECGCGHSLPPQGIDQNLLAVLDRIREKIGRPISILSGYRCPVHNQTVGGAVNSIHMEGSASDLWYEGIDVEHLAQVAEETLAELGIEGGVGRYPTQQFVHVDTRGYTARWDEND